MFRGLDPTSNAAVAVGLAGNAWSGARVGIR